MKAGRSRWWWKKGPKTGEPEGSDSSAEGAGIGALLVAVQGPEDPGEQLEIVPQRQSGGAKEVKAAAHGELARDLWKGPAQGWRVLEERNERLLFCIERAKRLIFSSTAVF